MEAGPEMDRIVAETMGWTGFRQRRAKEWCGVPPWSEEQAVYPVPEFSTEITAAWQVVEEMKRRGWLFHVLAMVDGWVVNARQYNILANGDWMSVGSPADTVQVEADTAPLAICRAALAAKEPR